MAYMAHMTAQQRKDILKMIDPNISEAYMEHRGLLWQWNVFEAIYFKNKTYEQVAKQIGSKVWRVKAIYNQAERSLIKIYALQVKIRDGK
jgi:hypothetical protein